MVKPKGGRKPKGRAQQKPTNEKRVFRKDDVYEAEDSDPEEEKNVNQRYDRVDNYEYELPSDFEDEEIDEDAAFNSEDERMYGHLFDKGGDAGGFSEDEEDEEEESGSDQDLLDSAEEEESGSEEEDADSEEDEEDEDSELDDVFARAGAASSDEEFEDQQEEEDEEALEDEEAAHQAMLQAVTGGATKERRKRKDVVVTEAYPESEYNLPAAGPEGELTLTDLISGLGDNRAKLGSARKTLERLEKKAAPVPAPLPGPIRDRQERKAGYEAAKKDIAKWMPVVKAHREAPTLHFKADQSEVHRTVTTASLAAKHAPETAMESEVAALLEAAGAQTAAAVAEAEDALAMKALSVAEAKERREKLAKMRALLFYHEVKAKRLKKIKSKEYRRRIKKAEKRKAEGAEDGEELLLDEEELRQAQEDAEFKRAQERLTLKHKNTSRFIRRALKRGGGGGQMDDGTKEAIAEQLRLGQELRERVHRMKSGRGGSSDTEASDYESSDDSSDSEDEESGRGRGELSKKAKAAALEILEGRGAPEGVEIPTQGLFSLPFMQRAMERRKAQAAEEARGLLELEGAGLQFADDQQQNGGVNGRMTFTGSDKADKLAQRVRKLEAAALASDSDEEGDEREDAEAKAERLGRQLRGEKAELDDSEGDGNVLQSVARKQAKISGQDRLFGGSGSGGVLAQVGSKKTAPSSSGKGIVVSVGPKKKNAIAVGAENGTGGKQKKSAAEQQNGDSPSESPEFISAKKFQGAKAGYVFKTGAKGVGYYTDAAAAATAAREAAKAVRRAQRDAAPKQQQQGRKNGRDAMSSDDEGNMRYGGTSRGNGAMGLSQEDLVRRAFAGDDVVAEFAAEKAAEVEGELPNEEVPGALPGWGTWAGSKREPRWAVEAKAKAAARREAAASGRKDAGLQYVVISEKWDKKNAKYRTPTVPFPFDSKDTYERAMRQPLGKDFNTDASFRNLTRPAVVKDAGVIIQPVRYSAAMSEYAKETETGSKRPAVLTVEGGMPKKAKLQKNKGGRKGKKEAA